MSFLCIVKIAFTIKFKNTAYLYLDAMLHITCILYSRVTLKNYMCLYVNAFEMHVVIHYDSRYV